MDFTLFPFFFDLRLANQDVVIVLRETVWASARCTEHLQPPAFILQTSVWLVLACTRDETLPFREAD